MHVGPHMDPREEDVFELKDALSRLGFYAYPEWGATSWPDIPLFDAIKKLQKQLNLRPTGEMPPFGPETEAVAAALKKLDAEERVEAGGGECAVNVRSYTQQRNGERVHVKAHIRACPDTGWADADSAHPSAPMRSPTAGGVFRSRDGYGDGAFGASRSGGERPHLGVDYEVKPGGQVFSPVGGVVIDGDVIAYDKSEEYRGVKIRTETGDVVKILYVKGSVPEGAKVEQGQPIGTAQDISKRYPPNEHGSMTPHIHMEVRDKNGRVQKPMIIKPETGRY